LFLTEYSFQIWSYSDVELAHTFILKDELFAVSEYVRNCYFQSVVCMVVCRMFFISGSWFAA